MSRHPSLGGRVYCNLYSDAAGDCVATWFAKPAWYETI